MTEPDPTPRTTASPRLGRRVPRSALRAEPLDVGRVLLGAVVTHGEVAIRLTEVEAYAGEHDPGSHAYRGRTPRTEVMFGAPGHLYVYFTYGMHWCANVVCGPQGTASAVLMRAGEVVAGHDLVATRRPGARERDWARGPARLATALGLGREHNGLDLCAADAVVRLRRGAAFTPVEPVRSGPRVGVSGPGGDASAYPWRLWLDGEPTVSDYRPAAPRR